MPCPIVLPLLAATCYVHAFYSCTMTTSQRVPELQSLLPRHSQPGTHAETVQRPQGGWANNNQWSLPAHTKAAILRTKLALRCCTAAALPFAQVGQQVRAGRPAWAIDTRATSWACQERASDLAKEVARFLRQFASTPLLTQLSTGCEAVAVRCYKATWLCACSAHTFRMDCSWPKPCAICLLSYTCVRDFEDHRVPTP